MAPIPLVPPTRFTSTRPSRCGTRRRSVPGMTPRHPARCGAMLVFISGLLVAFMLLGGLAIHLAQRELVGSERQTTTELAARATAVHFLTYGDPEAARTHGLELAAAHPMTLTSHARPTAEVQFGHTNAPQGGGPWPFRPGRAPYNSVRVTLPPPASVNPLAGWLRRPGPHGDSQRSLTTTVTFRDRDIVWLVDASLAATTTQQAPLRRAFGAFLNELQATPGETWVGLVVDGAPPQVVIPLSAASSQQASHRDTPWEQHAEMDRETREPSSPIRPTDSLAAGLQSASALLQQGRAAPHVDKTVIVLTGRAATLNPDNTPGSALQASDAVTLHAILWDPTAADIPRPSLADLRGGRVFPAVNGEQLTGLARQLARTIRTIRIE